MVFGGGEKKTGKEGINIHLEEILIINFAQTSAHVRHQCDIFCRFDRTEEKYRSISRDSQL